jgi:GxxExxY protein
LRNAITAKSAKRSKIGRSGLSRSLAVFAWLLPHLPHDIRIEAKMSEYDETIAHRTEPDSELDQLARIVIGAAIEVHRHLGPGLNELIYENALCEELRLQKIEFKRQVAMNVNYKGQEVGVFRLDLIIGGRLIVELKSIDTIMPIHKSQIMTYLRVAGAKLGLLINFNSVLLKDGIKR